MGKHNLTFYLDFNILLCIIVILSLLFTTKPSLMYMRSERVRLHEDMVKKATTDLRKSWRTEGHDNVMYYLTHYRLAALVWQSFCCLYLCIIFRFYTAYCTRSFFDIYFTGLNIRNWLSCDTRQVIKIKKDTYLQTNVSSNGRSTMISEWTVYWSGTTQNLNQSSLPESQKYAILTILSGREWENERGLHQTSRRSRTLIQAHHCILSPVWETHLIDGGGVYMA